jgi:hypothetical protein
MPSSLSTDFASTAHKKEAVSPTRAAPMTLKKGLWMTLAPEPLYPTGRTGSWILFDVRDARACEALHDHRGAFQEDTDIEAVDHNHFVLVVHPGRALAETEEGGVYGE